MEFEMRFLAIHVTHNNFHCVNIYFCTFCTIIAESWISCCFETIITAIITGLLMSMTSHTAHLFSLYNLDSSFSDSNRKIQRCVI